MANIPQLGRLERVTIRDVWKDEARHFTPWLAEPENLELLGKTIGIDLELVDKEVRIGEYRLDLLAQHAGSQESVIIENQFGGTDHSHLGQLLTYAAGVGSDATGARTIIWVAERFAEPHRSALDWLNKITEPGIGFFGVEVELWRIGVSPPAPKFNLVSKPNNWQKALTQQTAKAQTHDELYAEFWSTFIERARASGSRLRFPSPWGRQWLPITIGRSEFIVSLVVTKKDAMVRCELYMSGSRAKQAFMLISLQTNAIKAELGENLVFDQLPMKMASRIYEQRVGDVKDRSQWPELQTWLRNRAEQFANVFSPIVKSLDLDDDDDPDEADD